MDTRDRVALLTLAAAASAPRGLVGGKAAGFGTLIDAGLPVPEGFVLTTAADRAAAAAGSPRTVPAILAAAIAEALGAFGDVPLAVRSSASSEDGAERSFAGQYVTRLGVRGHAAVLDAVLECWASAAGDRALAYGDDGTGDAVGMAVIVQPLVRPEAAGVAFTADPLTGDRGTLVVNASYGLGEAVVAGIATPDDYRLARDDGRLLRLDIGDKDVMVVWDGDDVREVAVPESHRGARALGDAALAEIHRGALACEAVLGRPVDCEFCVCDGQVVWLQCRPLTALPDSRRSPT